MSNKSCFRLKFLLWCLMLQASSITVQGQDVVFAPIGATWSYSQSSSGPSWLTDPLFVQFIVERDTLIQDYPARVIGCYVNENNLMVRVDSLTKYVATIGDQVYFLVGNEFVLLFDFAAQQGDTIHSEVEGFSLDLGCWSDFQGEVIDYSYIIDSAKTLVIDEEVLRMQYLNSIYQHPEPNWVFRSWEPVIERIGFMGWGGWWWGSGEYCILEAGFLRCYSDMEINWRSPYFYNDNLPCDYISSSTEIQSSSYILHPNPAMTQVYLPQGAEQVELFDITGQRFLIENIGNEIDVSLFSSGMYFIRFELDGGMKVSSFVKL